VVQNQLDAFRGHAVNVYEVHAVTNDSGGDHLLISNITDLDQALFIEGEIESHLEIDDVDVPGSISRQTGEAVPKEEVVPGLDWDGHVVDAGGSEEQ